MCILKALSLVVYLLTVLLHGNISHDFTFEAQSIIYSYARYGSVAALSRCGFQSVYYLEVQNSKCFGTKIIGTHCSEFEGSRFSEVANTYIVGMVFSIHDWTLSTLGLKCVYLECLLSNSTVSMDKWIWQWKVLKRLLKTLPLYFHNRLFILARCMVSPWPGADPGFCKGENHK